MRTVNPWSYVHVTLQPGTSVAQTIPHGWTGTIYVFGGVAHIGPRELRLGDYAVFADDGDAIALANDLPTLDEYRRQIRQRMESSPLMDAPRFARNLESVYRTAWQKWTSESPADR